MSAPDILRDALFGNPPNAATKPSREGVLAAFTQLYNQSIVAGAAAAQGITTVATIGDRNTFYTTPDNRSKLVYVNNNNGSATDPANGVYEYVSGAARIAQGFYQGLASFVRPLVDRAEQAATEAASSAASINGVVSTAPLAPDQIAFVDSRGMAVAVIDSRGRILDTRGEDRFAGLARAIAAQVPAAVKAAPTPASKFAALRDGLAGGDEEMWERQVWAAGDSGAVVNTVRWPAIVATSPTQVTLFANERSGTADANNNGENGMRCSRRSVTLDFGARTAALGAPIVVLQPAGWTSYTGRVAEPVPVLITQGPNAGQIELLLQSLVPENVPFSTSGTYYNTMRYTSADNYATGTRIIDGLALAPLYGDANTGSQNGALQVQNSLIELSPSHANAGRRIFVAGYVRGDGSYTQFSAYSDVGSTSWQLGEKFPLNNIGATAVNEVSCVELSDGVHVYARNDEGAGVGTFQLAKRGRSHARSPSGIGGWMDKGFLPAPAIGNVASPVAQFGDGMDMVLIGGSTEATASERREFSYFIGHGGQAFVARVDAFPRASQIGYGHLLRHTDSLGRKGWLHAYEQGPGADGFNRNGGAIVLRWFTDAWLLRRAVAL